MAGREARPARFQTCGCARWLGAYRFWRAGMLPWARSTGERAGVSTARSTRDVFARVSWRDRRFFAITQAGLIEKFVDALVWALYPAFLLGRDATLTELGWIVGVYGVVWGGSQLLTGPLSDRVGRYWPKVSGMWISGSGVGLMLMGSGSLWWSFSAAVTGFGMALLYPNLSAAIADLSEPACRGKAIGIYRFWRDLGYAIGALGLGLSASLAGAAEADFWFVALAMGASGLILFWLGEETHPRLRKQSASDHQEVSS